jgi:hypothetical protein
MGQGGTKTVTTAPMTFTSANGGAPIDSLSSSTLIVGGTTAMTASGDAADTGDSGGCMLVGRDRRLGGELMILVGIGAAVLIRRRRF